MKAKSNTKLQPCILCILLAVAMALLTVGCNGSTGSISTEEGTGIQADSNVLGEGSKVFTFIVVDVEGNETDYEIHTDEESVGAALYGLGLIDGEQGDFGLYVKKVNGITADYDKDNAYWSFYVNDAYAPTGVDSIQITEGDSYSFKMEKGWN